MTKKLLILPLLLLPALFCSAQIEVLGTKVKDFSAIGFGAALNFGIPVSEGNAVTVEGGIQYFSKAGEDVGNIPALLGYRYTLDQTGTGFYVEPHAGYNFGMTTIGKYTENGSPIYENGEQVFWKVNGPMAGVGFGYLFEPSGKIQFNVSLRYQLMLAEAKAHVFGLRITHAFSFGRRDDY